MASYPGAVKSFVSRNAGDVIQPAHINDLQDEVNAIEAGLLNGTAPLNSSNSTMASLSVVGNATFGSSTIKIGTVPYIWPSSGPAVGQVLMCTSTSGSTSSLEWRASIGGTQVLDKATTEQVVNNSTTATSVYSFSVPGGTLGTNKTMRLTVTGYYSNTSGGNSLFTVAVAYGATTIATGSLQNFQTATTGPFELLLWLNANGATNSQRAVVQIRHGVDAIATAVAGWTSSQSLNAAYHDALAEDTTAAKTLSVTITHGTANALITFKAWTRILEVLG